MSINRQDEHTDQLLVSVKQSLADAERLMKEAAAATGDSAAELRDRALTSIRRTREALYDAQDAVYEGGRRALRATDDYVHDYPWCSIGTAAAVGLVLGILIGRR